MTDSFNVREFKSDDIRHVVYINKQTLPENYPDQFFLGLHYHAPKAFLVAEVENEIVGYIMCRIERGISSFGRMPVKKGHIVSVAVLDEHRHKGIGTTLIKGGMEAMTEYGSSEFFLEVRKGNEDAVSVYGTLGFSVHRVLRGYYRDGEDAYLMVCRSSCTSEEVSDPEQTN
ncbi:MAG: GNAT family N-acetyltransferase [Candidatus Thorarchaeota archaeon]